jgi:vacuolar-type H+-ATPase catalytic subunit A/Vma1
MLTVESNATPPCPAVGLTATIAGAFASGKTVTLEEALLVESVSLVAEIATVAGAGGEFGAR